MLIWLSRVHIGESSVYSVAEDCFWFRRIIFTAVLLTTGLPNTILFRIYCMSLAATMFAYAYNICLDNKKCMHLIRPCRK